MLKKIALLLALALAGFLIFAASRPDTYHVERSIEIAAPAEAIFPFLVDFKAWGEWSPWDKIDPALQKSYDGPPGVVGSGYRWQGNSDVGKGRMTITELEPLERVGYELEFIEPFAAVASSKFVLKPAAGGSTRATWSMDGHNTFVSKVFGLFMDMDAMIGKDFEKGLASLRTVSQDAAKKIAETNARAAAAAAEAAAAKAAAQAAPPATPAP